MRLSANLCFHFITFIFKVEKAHILSKYQLAIAKSTHMRQRMNLIRNIAINWKIQFRKLKSRKKMGNFGKTTTFRVSINFSFSKFYNHVKYLSMHKYLFSKIRKSLMYSLNNNFALINLTQKVDMQSEYKFFKSVIFTFDITQQ